MNHKKITAIALALVIIHFIFTSVIVHYIAIQVGTQMGQIVATGLMDSSSKASAKSEEGAAKIYQSMKKENDEILDNWKVTTTLIFLPAKPFMSTILKEMRDYQIKKVETKEITWEQFRTRGMIMDYTATFVNSLLFGLLAFITLKLFHQYKLKNSNPSERGSSRNGGRL